ncbi:helix-turn-helix domain-containing protein [Formosa sp. S-31]|uniref:helix-turn-helix domain-containing protein n=1 Tax=Formosa sp. S-31 TaxID=2790949 RepID=UPI003EBB2356
MINTSEFSQRLQKVIDFYGESASSFSEKIGVQRSSISHILSGRNKPSLDFVLKILSAYPEVELYWLLNGKGSFPKHSADPVSQDLFSNEVDLPRTPEIPETTPKKQHEAIPKQIFQNTEKKQIERIVVFYTDGTFKNFEEL